MPEFAMGDRVWRATWEAHTAWVACPDCGTTGRIRCILHDDTEVSIECGGCRSGYDPPKGYVHAYDRKPHAEPCTINRVEISEGKIEFGTTTTYTAAPGTLFATQEDAQQKADEIAAAADAAERAAVFAKEKDTRSWGWHVHYHRSRIREAEKEIAYHTAKLNVARIKAKEPV